MTSKLSIVVPVFNSRLDLERLIESLSPQLDSHELIVVNDGSTDKEVTSIQERDARIRAVHFESNVGSSAARNAGVRAASGERILFIDADCVAAPQCLQSHVRFHEEFPDDGCIGNILPMETNSLLLRYLDEGPSPMFGLKALKPEHYHFISYNFFYTVNSSVPRNRLLEAGLFDQRYNAAWDDIELGFRLERQGLRFRYNAQAVVRHRNPDSFRRFLSRQARVGKGYWRLHRHHPEMLGSLTFRNQWEAVKEGLASAWRAGRTNTERVGFASLEMAGKSLFWYGYLRESYNDQ